MRTFVDPDTCLGCGICETIAPNVFKLGSDPVAVVLLDPVPAGEEANVREAMDACPEQAISIEE
ncbi:MAG: ferredoxin [Anaerolineae bacterium]|nr:ferredoxin [Anaerolineae bacterium]